MSIAVAFVLTLAGVLPSRVPPPLTRSDVALGAALVCAEARGASPLERRAIAGVVRNRVQRLGRSVAAVVRAHRQFAPLCPRRMVEPSHAVDFVAGWLGLAMPAWWSADVWAFQTHRSMRRGGGRKWRDVYGWRRVDAGRLLHTFWEGSP